MLRERKMASTLQFILGDGTVFAGIRMAAAVFSGLYRSNRVKRACVMRTFGVRTSAQCNLTLLKIRC